VVFDGPPTLMGRLATVRVVGADAGGTQGTLEPRLGRGEGS